MGCKSEGILTSVDDPEAPATTPRLNRIHPNDWELVRFEFSAHQSSGPLDFGDNFWEF